MTTNKELEDEDTLDNLETLQRVLGIEDMCGIECPYCNQDIDLKEDIDRIKSKTRKELIEEIKAIMYGKIDWIKVFKDAYESRKTAWKELGHIREWRNATDEILFAVWNQLEQELKEKSK